MPNRKYTRKVDGKIYTLPCDDPRKLYVPVGCGKCMECLKQKASGWRIRLLEEIREDNRGKFVTLSFSDKSLKELADGTNGQGYNLDNAIATKAVRRFLERWRKKTGKSVKHWLVTELGEKNTERLHIHGIIFTNDIKLIRDKWTYGNVWIGSYVNETTAGYIIKYIHKQDKKHKYYIPKILTSPGIGKGYLERTDVKRNKFSGPETKDNYKSKSGHIMAMPQYYRNKIYTEQEREQLWMQKLDKQTRYVNGLKIDVSDSLDDYYKALEYARTINKRMGFNSDEINWQEYQYEQSLRKLGQKTRNKK